MPDSYIMPRGRRKRATPGVKFSYYGYDQAKMYEMICGATKEVVAAHPEIGLVMNSMDAIQNVRTSYFGDNVTRDGLASQLYDRPLYGRVLVVRKDHGPERCR